MNNCSIIGEEIKSLRDKVTELQESSKNSPCLENTAKTADFVAQTTGSMLQISSITKVDHILCKLNQICANILSAQSSQELEQCWAVAEGKNSVINKLKERFLCFIKCHCLNNKLPSIQDRQNLVATIKQDADTFLKPMIRQIGYFQIANLFSTLIKVTLAWVDANKIHQRCELQNMKLNDLSSRIIKVTEDLQQIFEKPKMTPMKLSIRLMRVFENLHAIARELNDVKFEIQKSIEKATEFKSDCIYRGMISGTQALLGAITLGGLWSSADDITKGILGASVTGQSIAMDVNAKIYSNLNNDLQSLNQNLARCDELSREFEGALDLMEDIAEDGLSDWDPENNDNASIDTACSY